MAGAGRGMIELSVDQAQLRRVASTLRSMADGKVLVKELRTELRAAAEPVVVQAQTAILSAPAASTADPGLRQQIASKIGVQTRLVGRDPAVAIRARKTPGMRRFRSAAKNFNEPSFRHQVFGRNAWVVQVGAPRWFDNAIDAHRRDFHQAAMKAIDHWAAEAARRMEH